MQSCFVQDVRRGVLVIVWRFVASTDCLVMMEGLFGLFCCLKRLYGFSVRYLPVILCLFSFSFIFSYLFMYSFIPFTYFMSWSVFFSGCWFLGFSWLCKYKSSFFHSFVLRIYNGSFYLFIYLLSYLSIFLFFFLVVNLLASLDYGNTSRIFSRLYFKRL